MSNRRAVSINLRFFGAVRANSFAILRPIPEEAPVIRMVFPWSRADTADDALCEVVYSLKGDEDCSGRQAAVVRMRWESVRSFLENIDVD